MTVPARLVVGAMAVLTLALAGCADPAPTGGERPLGPADFRGSGLGPCPGPSGSPVDQPTDDQSPELRSVQLPCMHDATSVDLSRPVGRPVVLNLWASWCRPCAQELPAFQRLHDRAGGRLTVIGVNTEDGVDRAVSAAADLRLSFPSVYDRGGEVLRSLRRVALPVTAFVDARGRVVAVYNGPALTDAALAALVRRHLAVAVP